MFFLFSKYLFLFTNIFWEERLDTIENIFKKDYISNKLWRTLKQIYLKYNQNINN